MQGSEAGRHRLPAHLAAAIHEVETVCRQIALGRIAARQLASQARTVGLSEAEFRLLWQLRSAEAHRPRRDAPDQTELSTSLGISPAQVSALVDRLGQRNLISGMSTPGDRRKHVWRLASPGFALLEQCLLKLSPQLDQPIVPVRGTLPGEAAA